MLTQLNAALQQITYGHPGIIWSGLHRGRVFTQGIHRLRHTRHNRLTLFIPTFKLLTRGFNQGLIGILEIHHEVFFIGLGVVDQTAQRIQPLLLKTMEHKHPAYRQLLGYQPGTPATKMSADLMTDVSPISFTSKDDPPIMQVHGDNDVIVPIEHARRLHVRLESVGVSSQLITIEEGNHGVAGAGPAGRQKTFMQAAPRIYDSQEPNVIAGWVTAVAQACDRDRTTRFDAAGCILLAAEKATWMASQAIQALGGNGYINEYPAGRLLRDAKLYEIGAGTSEIRRMLIGRELFNASH